MHNNGKNYCRVCGFYDETLPWGDDMKSPTYHFCPCCGVEHGYGDFNQKSTKMWREKWVTHGAQWDDKTVCPEGWKLEEQLKNIPEEYK